MDRSSDSDVVMVFESKEIRRNSQELINIKTWECPMCTFLNEDISAFRCKVCESKRPGSGKKTRKLSQWLSQPADKTEEEQSNVRKVSGAQAEPVEVIDSSESDDAAGISGGATDLRWSNDINGKLMTAKSNRRLWADLYAPNTVEELCMSKKKVQEISEWLQGNASPHMDVFQKRLLFLCGPPGSGKSTAVRCIARQKRLFVKEWKDNSAAGKIKYERMLRKEFWTQPMSGVDDFSDFIHRSSTYTALPVATSRRVPCVGRKRRLLKSQVESSYLQASSTSAGELILLESWPQSWCSKEQAVYEEKLQRIYQHVIDPAGSCHYPVVCIYSDVQGSKIDLEHLSQKFSREVMHSPLTSVININAVTSAQLKKHLSRVCAQENYACQSVDIQKIIDSSNGDIRHALNMLQVLQSLSVNNKPRMALALASKKKRKEKGVSACVKISSSTSSSARDFFLSNFHVVGKLLHGKMLQRKCDDESEVKYGANDADYDQILDATAMPLDRVLGLVYENSIAYFSQVEDLSDALGLMSLCEVMVNNSYNGASNLEASKRSREVAQAMLLRTVAITNKNPTPKAFRPITRPRTYTAKQRIVSRREDMELVTRGGDYGLQYACTGDTFAFEVEPFLTIMDAVGGRATRPNEVGSSFAINSLSLQDVVDDEIENSDEGW
ncbi:unnamed protein product [Peronospora destructor]|uniref:RanBP2-type domain-containing protein n=1 Tax=Peronospora destructor TaxID=86335 RepID=A0AAV0V903_9STRA|nr:unnamed protein product [Peronospora destructor]